MHGLEFITPNEVKTGSTNGNSR